MAKVALKHPNERFDNLLRRFKAAVEKDDLIKELRSREAYEKPSERRKRKKAAAKKRQERITAEQKRQFLPQRQR